jgi:hypothetical protein
VLLRQAHRFAAVGGFADHLKPFTFEQRAQSLPHDVVIVCEHDA